MATSKSLVVANYIANDITRRVPALSLIQGFDTNGNPTIAIGTGSAGAQNVFIRVRPVSGPTGAVNGIGDTQAVYGPHIIELVLEQNSVSGTVYLTEANRAAIFNDLITRGSAVALFLTANGTAPTVAGITGTATAFWANLENPLTNQI